MLCCCSRRWDGHVYKDTKTSGSNKKEMCKIFKKHNLQITIEANQKVVDFLDITLDLRTGAYKPYKKPNNNIAYIHKQSNHPPSTIKNLPKGINKRLSINSNNAQTFKEAIPPYIEALKRVGTTHIYSSIRSLPRSAMKTKQENAKSHGLIPPSTSM